MTRREREEMSVLVRYERSNYGSYVKMCHDYYIKSSTFGNQHTKTNNLRVMLTIHFTIPILVVQWNPLLGGVQWMGDALQTKSPAYQPHKVHFRHC